VHLDQIADGREHHRHVSGDKIGERRCRSLVGNVPQLDARGASDQEIKEMRQRPRTGRAECGARRIGLHPRDQFLQRRGRRFWPDRQRHIEGCDLRHRGKVSDRIVFQVLVDMLTPPSVRSA
jgi:hypothetical protein